MTHSMPFTGGLTDTAAAPPREPLALSPDRAFVVHFYAAAAGAATGAGRVEHVRSGRTTHFQSWEELAAFVAVVMGAAVPGPGATR